MYDSERREPLVADAVVAVEPMGRPGVVALGGRRRTDEPADTTTVGVYLVQHAWMETGRRRRKG